MVVVVVVVAGIVDVVGTGVYVGEKRFRFPNAASRLLGMGYFRHGSLAQMMMRRRR